MADQYIGFYVIFQSLLTPLSVGWDWDG